MKKIYLLLLLATSLFTYSQTPQYINYQGVARNNSGNPVSNSPLSLTLSVINPAIVFSESHAVITNSLGLFSLKIGSGTLLTAATPFSSINWATGSYSLNIVADAGSGAVNLGEQKLVSVPYALYAEKAANVITYSASPNIQINGANIIDLTDLISATGAYGDLGTAQSKIPIFTVDQKGRLTSAGEYTANVSGDIQGTLDNQLVKKLNGVPVASVNPINGQVLQFNGTNWSPANIATGGVTTINTGQGIIGGPITSVGTISLQPTGVLSNTYGAAPNIIPTFSVDNLGRIITAGSYTLSPPVTSTYVAGQNIAITPSGTVNTISSPSYSINFPTASSAIITNGTSSNTASIPQPTLTSGSGIVVTGTGPTFTISSGATGLNAPWVLGGNNGTSPGTHYLGTGDNQNLIFKTNNAQVASMTTLGRMGIGLSAPASTLSVFGNLAIGSSYGSITAPVNSAILQGSLGIGTTNPGSALHLEGSNASTNIFLQSASPETHIRIHNTNVTNNNFGSLAFSTVLSNSGQIEMAKIVGQNVNHTSTNIMGDLVLLTRNTSNLNEVMRLTSAGNVGIGTSTPSDKLEVIGKTATDSLQVTSPTTPTTGAILISRDNNGNTKWSPGPVAFEFHFAPFAPVSVNTNTVNNLGNNLQFSGAPVVSVGGGFNTTNSQFTAPVTGLYSFEGSIYVLMNAAAGNNWIYLDLCKNPGTPVVLKRDLMNNTDASITTYTTLRVHALVNLTAGEIVFLRAVGASGGGGGNITTNNSPNLINSFSGYLIR